MPAACVLLCATALTPVSTEPVVVAAPANTVQAAGSASAAAAARTRLVITAFVSGAPAGDVTVETDLQGNAAVDIGQLASLLEPTLSRSAIENLRSKGAAGEFVPITELNSEGFSIAFDFAALRLNIVIPLEARATNELSVVDRGGYNRLGLTPPENFSAGVSVTIADRFQHASTFGDIDREPFNVLIEGFANFGGIDGINLTFQGGYREGDNLVRQRTTLFHDDVRNAIRYSAGDLDPQSFGAYAVPVSMIGIGVERLYQTIQPFRNLRPAGRGSLAIERPSRVDVLVNGVLYRTLDLAPGQYNIRDFPFIDGSNEVQLVVRDETGREETIGLSFFSDIDLLEEDLSIFSAALGFRQRRFGSFVSTAYEETPIFSGFYLRGITDKLTLGGALQFDRRNALFNGQAVFATPVGVIGIEGAVDLSNKEAAQGAFILSYRYQLPAAGGQVRRFVLDLQYQTARFSPMELADTQRNRTSWDINGRYETDLGVDTYATVSAGYSWGRDSNPDVRTASLSLTRRFDRINAGFNYSYRHDERGTDHRGVFSISVPIGPRQSARASYDTERNRVSVGYDLQGFEGLNQTDLRVAAARSDAGRSADIDLEHFSNRFRAAVRHSYDRSGGSTSQFTDVAVSFGLGYADGRLALGRDAARGFTIVDRHRSLGDSDVIVQDSFSLGPAAKTGALGPALVPTRRAYQPNVITVDVSDIPVGYDIGPGRYDILPGAASGYRIMIGSAASNTVLGRLLDAAGEPLVFAAGTLRPQAGTDAQPVQFFTNRTGRMAATRVAPGRYDVILAGRTRPIGEIVVPEDAEGIVDIGELRTGGGE